MKFNDALKLIDESKEMNTSSKKDIRSDDFCFYEVTLDMKQVAFINKSGKISFIGTTPTIKDFLESDNWNIKLIYDERK